MLNSCKSDIDDLIVDQVNSENIIMTETDSTFMMLSKTLASTVSDKNVLKTISDKVLQKIDGDCNALFVDVINTRIESGELRTSGKVLLDLMEENYLEENSGLRSTRSDFIDKINKTLNENPLLQVAIPFWDTDFNGDISQIQNPVVAFLPESYDEKNTDWIIGFDMHGKEVKINAKIQPNYPVIIISLNERLIAVPNTTRLRSSSPLGENYQLVYSSSSYDYYAPFPGFGGGNSGLPNPPKVLYPTNIDRDSYSYRDYLAKARFTSQDAMREFESWGRGRPEVDFAYAYTS